jgi:hypothetical protein
MNAYVLQMKSRLPVKVRSRVGGAYYSLISLIDAVPPILRDTRVLLSHLSADVVPAYYWRRIKRFAGVRS